MAGHPRPGELQGHRLGSQGLPGGPVSPGEGLVGGSAGGLWRDLPPLSHTLEASGDKDCLPAQKLVE